MRCMDDEILSAFADGEAEDAEAVSRHVRACAQCRGRLSRIERLGRRIREAAGEACLDGDAFARALAGDASPAEERHLEACADCREEMEALETSLADAESDVREAMPSLSAARASRILAAARRASEPRAIPMPARIWVPVAAAAALVAAILIFKPGPAPTTSGAIATNPANPLPILPGPGPVLPTPVAPEPVTIIPEPDPMPTPAPETPKTGILPEPGPIVQTPPTPVPAPVPTPTIPKTGLVPAPGPIVQTPPTPTPSIPEGPSPGRLQAPVAIVLEVRGEIRHGAGRLIAGGPVFSDEPVAVPLGGLASLALEGDDHRIVAGGGTRLRIGRAEGPAGPSVRIELGDVLVASAPPVAILSRRPKPAVPGAPGAVFTTPEARIRLLGTVLQISRVPGETTLRVQDGAARLETDRGNVDVRARQVATARANLPPSKPASFEDFWSTASFALDWAPGSERLMREDFSGSERDVLPKGFSPFDGGRLQVAGAGAESFVHIAIAGGFLAGEAAWTNYVASADFAAAPGVPVALLALAASPESGYEVLVDGERRLSIRKRADAGGDVAKRSEPDKAKEKAAKRTEPEKEKDRAKRPDDASKKDRKARAEPDAVALTPRAGPAVAGLAGLGAEWFTVKVMAAVQNTPAKTRVVLMAKAWKRGTPEPAAWMVQATDTGASGRGRHARPYLLGRVGVDLLDASSGGLDVDNLTVIRLPK